MKGKTLGDLGKTEQTISGRQTTESFKSKVSQKPEINKQKNPTNHSTYNFYSPH